MESGQRRPRKGRKLGSSRRRQTREPADGQDASGDAAPGSWPSQASVEVQRFLRDCGAQDRGFVTRDDLAVAKFSFLGSEEAPERIFDWVDTEQQGRLSLDEFSSGLESILGSLESSPGLHRRRTRVPLPHGPGPEEADAQKEMFSAFMEQWGTGTSFPDEAEVWPLWQKLRQEEAPLAGNLEGFLATMNSRLQEARDDKEVLELALRKCDSDHHRKVQQLYEEMEQQLHQEKQQLQAKSESRDLALSSQMQAALEAKERETQRLAEAQRELEARMQQLSASQQQASSEQRQLQEAERDLARHLEEVQGQLQVTRRQLTTSRGHVSWQMEEKQRDPGAGERQAATPQEVSPVEAPLPGVFGDNEDWEQLLGSFSAPEGALQICWSPPPSPASPSAPRVVRQISISEAQALPCTQGPPPPARAEVEGPAVPQGARSQELTPRLPAVAETRALPGPARIAAGTEGDRRPPESKPEDPGTTGSVGQTGQKPSTGATPGTDPDHVFHVVFLGDSSVGKTSFLHLLHHDRIPSGLTATVGVDFRVKTVLVDNETFALQLWDTAGQERYHSVAHHLLRKADAAVLMYDITSWDSFAHVRSWLSCLQEAGCDRAAILLLGNKTDCEEARQVPTEAGQQLAQELGATFGECSATLGHNILEPVVSLARSLKVQEDRLKGGLVEVAGPQPPPKAGCCP
ncbi:ras-related protein Rab-44 [Sorex fumeus]|uniref:ras-related protein Rab-44 n=1 Tax=Sorex fumeus TaxID=62283 RepID=UPI0024ACEF35|nr:ras-related protein Rab-44 [Sorex fumeus]